MIRRFILTCVLLLLPLTGVSAQQAQNERKVALILANGSYESATQLTNPKNDAQLIAASARKAGFDTVTLVENMSLVQFQRALRDFREQANGAGVAMVYYAGHGIEGAGKNWLIPVDAQLKSDLDLPYEAIDLDRVLEAISGAQVRMVVLDACRNNPFGRSWKATTRAVQRGLGGIDVDDVLVIYAAAPGQTASDGDSGNSPFATSLAKRLTQPDLPIQLLGGAVRDDVLASTGGAQRPFVSASITGTPVYLVPRSVNPPAQTGPTQASIDEATLDALGWQGALGAQSIAAFEEYKAQFPKGRFVKLADQNIVRLRSVGAPAPTPAPARSEDTPPQPGRVTTAAARPPAAAAVSPRISSGNGGTRKLPPPALIFPDSSSRRLGAADLAPLELVQITLARNEIFARHGFIFNKPVFREYFGRFDWYTPTSRAVQLNPIEQANVQLMLQAERARSAKP